MPSPDGVRAWQAAIQIAVRTRALLTHFPRRGYAELRDQMLRSSESIGNNIAEGRGSKFPREYVRFLDTAARSSVEVSSQLVTAMEYGIVPRREAFNLNSTVICVRKMIESLRDSVHANYLAERARKRKAKQAKKPKATKKPETSKPPRRRKKS